MTGRKDILHMHRTNQCTLYMLFMQHSILYVSVDAGGGRYVENSDTMFQSLLASLYSNQFTLAMYPPNAVQTRFCSKDDPRLAMGLTTGSFFVPNFIPFCISHASCFNCWLSFEPYDNTSLVLSNTHLV